MDALALTALPEDPPIAAAPAGTTAAKLLGTASSKAAAVLMAGVTTILASRALGPSGRGTYFVLVTLATTATTVGHMSVEHAQIFLWSKAEQRPRLEANAVVLGVFIGLSAALVAWAVTHTVYRAALPGSHGNMVVVVLAAIPIAMMSLYLNGILVLHGRIGRVNIGMLISAVLQCAITAALVGWGELTVPRAIAIWLIGVVVPFCVALSAVRPRFAKFSLPVAVREVGVGLRLHIGMVSLVLLYRVDVFLLNSRVSDAQLGLYSVAVVIAELAFLITDSVAQVALPRQVTGPLDESGQLTARLARTNLVGSVIVVVAIVSSSGVLIPVLFGRPFAGSFAALVALCPGIIGLAVTRPVGGFLIRLGQPLRMSAVYASAMVLNVGLNLVLIPHFGIVGAALASSAAYVALAVVNVSWLVRAGRLPLRTLVPMLGDIRDPMNALTSRLRQRV
jgi:O-antigen/teichoic acid export membrane protein